MVSTSVLQVTVYSTLAATCCVMVRCGMPEVELVWSQCPRGKPAATHLCESCAREPWEKAWDGLMDAALKETSLKHC